MGTCLSKYQETIRFQAWDVGNMSGAFVHHMSGIIYIFSFDIYLYYSMNYMYICIVSIFRILICYMHMINKCTRHETNQ